MKIKVVYEMLNAEFHMWIVQKYVNEERSESKTDAQQKWSTPSQKIQALYPKGQTVEQIFGKSSSKASDFKVRVQGEDQEVSLGKISLCFA